MKIELYEFKQKLFVCNSNVEFASQVDNLNQIKEDLSVQDYIVIAKELAKFADTFTASMLLSCSSARLGQGIAENLRKPTIELLKYAIDLGKKSFPSNISYALKSGQTPATPYDWVATIALADDKSFILLKNHLLKCIVSDKTFGQTLTWEEILILRAELKNLT